MVMDRTQWTEKYRPKTLTEVRSNDKAIAELKEWAEKWDKRAVILYGPPGIGKTSAAHALANDMGWDTIELNASDQRTANIIKKIAGSAAQTGTFEGATGRRLVILDEADNIYGNADRGGTKAIADVIKKTKHPLILIANEYYEMSKALRALCKPIQFRAIQSKSIIHVLKKICGREKIECDVEVLNHIAENAPDFRSAVNDLQAIAQGRTKLDIKDVAVGLRDTRESIFKVLAKIFKSHDLKGALHSSYALDESPEDFIHWIDENIPREYEGNVLVDAFECLSRADIFLGRVRRRQNYGLWRYAGEMMVCGVQHAKIEPSRGYTPYKPPTTWRRMGLGRSMKIVRDSAAAKIGGHCHVSKQCARSDLIPFFRTLFKDHECAVGISALLCLNIAEIAFLLNVKADSKKAQKVHDMAQEYIEREMEHAIEIFGGFDSKGANQHKQPEQHELFGFD